MSQIIRKGMDHYWQVIYSKDDAGLDADEIKWKRDHEEDMIRLDKKFGPLWDAQFGKSK